jgi:hypothetical protein
MRRVPVLAMLVCVAVAACSGSAVAPATAPPLVTDRPTAGVAGATASARNAESSLAVSQGAPTASDSAPAASVYPAGTPGALQYLQAYENSLIGGHYEAAWAMLGSGYQTLVGGETNFENDRTQFMTTAGHTYNVVANPTNVPPLAELLKDKPFAASIDQKGAVVLEVKWTSLVQSGATPELWVANPNPTTGWELYRLR